MLTSWSHSSLTEFDKCRRRVYLMKVQKIPEPQAPLPEGKTEHANDRGSRVHEGCDHFITSQIDAMPWEAEKHFGTHIAMLRTLHDEGMVSTEGEWGMNENWEPTDWRSAWHRCKLDAIVHLSPVEAIVIDFKTGKRFGNEIKHAEQMQLYQLNSFLRFPDLETVTTELWYLDIGERHIQTYTRAQGLRFKSNFDRRGKAMTSNTDWSPRPNVFSCRWCQYGPWGTGHCEVGVRR